MIVRQCKIVFSYKHIIPKDNFVNKEFIEEDVYVIKYYSFNIY
jgi:hypothetical protein